MCRPCKGAAGGWADCHRREDAQTRGRSGRPWKRLRDQVISEETRCFRCGLPVDKALPPMTSLSVSVDHIVPLSKGGDPLDRANVALAHYGCNARAGSREYYGHPPLSQSGYADALLIAEWRTALTEFGDGLISALGAAEALRVLRALTVNGG